MPSIAMLWMLGSCSEYICARWNGLILPVRRQHEHAHAALAAHRVLGGASRCRPRSRPGCSASRRSRASTYSNRLPSSCIAMSLNASVGPFDSVQQMQARLERRQRRDRVVAERRARVGARRRCARRSAAGMSSMKRDSIANASSRIGQRRAARRARRRRTADSARGTARPPSGARPSSRIARERLRRRRAHAPRVLDVAASRMSVELFEPDAHDLARAPSAAPRSSRSRRRRSSRRVRCVSMMMSVWSSPSGGSFWIIASIEIVAVGEDARDVGEHAGLVVDAHAQVVATSRPRPSAGSARRTAGRAGTRDAARDARDRRCACA